LADKVLAEKTSAARDERRRPLALFDRGAAFRARGDGRHASGAFA
jgi:hypothetical protein